MFYCLPQTEKHYTVYMFPNEQGLSENEARQKLAQYGPNVLPEVPAPGRFTIALEQIQSPLVYVLLFAGIVTAAIGHVVDALIIFIAVLLNTVLGYIQEHRASSALHALKRYITNKATVIREGKKTAINTTDIVPGDVIFLNQGNKIPADGTLTFTNRLYIDESMLTGESMSVAKKKGDEAYLGTTISSGQATMTVEKTGAGTKMGAIAGTIQEPEADTPLQRQLKGFSRQLVVVIIVLSAIAFILGIAYQLSITELFITSVALAVSSIPEGLLVSLTVVLAIGMQKILKHRGLVRKLSAAETLGGVTVICVDKTGTLTQGNMEVVAYDGDIMELAKQVLLANDLDDPIVIAAFAWGRTVIKDFISQHPRLDSIPFSPKDRMFTSLHTWSQTANMLFVNGAPELLLAKSNLTGDAKRDVLETIDSFTKQGKRVLGFARKEVPANITRIDAQDADMGLDWIGLLAFADPVRLGVKDALDQAKTAGITTTVITGDYPQTSEFILKELGISVTKDEIFTGTDLDRLSQPELAKIVRSVKLFARTTPDQKLRIVQALKRNGEVVAMMGDGVNDAPALHKADIGIVVGEATDVAKESADLVLLDSNFSTIIAAIREGRAMFDNIRKVILYLLSDAFAEIVVVIGAIALGLPLPISAVQILWINLISDGFPNLALTIDPVRPDIMKEKPRSPKERLVNFWMISLIGTVSIIAGFVALVTFIFTLKATGDVASARSMAFLTLGLNSLAYVFSVRTLLVPFWKNHVFENKWLLIAVFAGFGLQVLPFSTSVMRQFFGLKELHVSYWLIAIFLSVALFFVIEACKAFYRLRSFKALLR